MPTITELTPFSLGQGGEGYFHLVVDNPAINPRERNQKMAASALQTIIKGSSIIANDANLPGDNLTNSYQVIGSYLNGFDLSLSIPYDAIAGTLTLTADGLYEITGRYVLDITAFSQNNDVVLAYGIDGVATDPDTILANYFKPGQASDYVSLEGSQLKYLTAGTVLTAQMKGTAGGSTNLPILTSSFQVEPLAYYTGTFVGL